MNTFRNNLILLACGLILGLAFNYLFFERIPGISFFVFMAAGFIIFYGLHRYFKRPYKPLVGLTVVMLFLSLMVGVRSSHLLTFLNIALVLYLVLVLVREAKGQPFKLYGIKDYITTLVAPVWHALVNCLRTLGELLSLQGVLGGKQSASTVIKGLLMALPVVLIFLALFASADLAFRQFLIGWYDLNLSDEFIAHVVMIAGISLASLGGLAYVFVDTTATTAIEGEKPVEAAKRINTVQISVFLVAIVALFLLFIVFQFRYFFGGDANIIQAGFTYAEYAHRGFGELIAVALISLVLIMVTERYVDRKDETHARSFKVLSLLLVAEVVILMASAFKRLHIYQEAYGFTNLRLYVSAFIVWLSLLFVVFAYKVWKNKKDRFFARAIFVGVIMFIAFMNIINPEMVIVRQNIRHYHGEQKIDLAYFHNLSADGVPAMLRLLDEPDEKIRRSAGYSLYQRLQRMEQDGQGWPETNLARAHAWSLLNRRKSELEQYKNDSGYINWPAVVEHEQ